MSNQKLENDEVLVKDSIFYAKNNENEVIQ